jgi:hypothetical protein
MRNALIEKAIEYIGYGLSVIPVKSDKSPAIRSWSPYQKKCMVTSEVQSYFNKPDANGIGIICGAVSGNLEVIDVDLKYDKSGLLGKELEQLIKESLPEVFKKLVVANTINKGWHLLYRCDVIEGNQKLAANSDGEVLIETRGEGGYIIASPTPGYQFISSQISEIPTITKEERELLFLIARSFDETEKTEDGIYGYQDDEDSPFGDFNSRADVPKMLIDHGWEITGKRNEAIYFKRPGKQGSGVSASWHINKKVFYPFTTSTEFVAGKGYSPTGVFTFLECGGDYSVASRKLIELGFGEKVQTMQDKKLPRTSLLPIKGFPELVQRFIITASEVLCVPRDFFAGGVLMAVALGIGNKLELVTKFRNVPILWMCIVGEVSSGKTEPINICLKPLADLDAKLFKEYNDDMKEFYRLSKLNKDERLAEGIAELIRPKRFQYLISDYTPEALAKVHSINLRGLLISRDELKGLLDDFGRYNKSGEESAMLSSYNQVDININRKNSDDIFIRKPMISMIGGLQPNILPSLSANNREENGFLARFCFVYPDNSKRPNYINKTLPKDLVDEYEAFILKLTTWSSSKELFLTKEAQLAYEVFYNNNSTLINDEAAGYLKGVYGKLDIIALRIAIVIKGMIVALEDDKSNMITEDIMKSAIEITEYFRATALKVYRKIFNKNEASLSKNEVAIYLHKETALSKTQIANYLKVHRQQVQRWTCGITKKET